MIKVFSQRVMDVFAKYNCDYDQLNDLMQSRYLDKEIFDKNGNKVSADETDSKIAAIFSNMLGVENWKKATKRERKRAIEDNGKEVFRLMEETIDIAKDRGFHANEWFNTFVEEKNLAKGDDNLFTSEKDVILNVARVSGGHHDIALRRLAGRESYSLPMYTYAVAVGDSIDQFLMGYKSWPAYVDAIATAYLVKIQTEAFAEVLNFNDKTVVPAAFKGSTALTQANKAKFDQVLSYVSTANAGAPVTIFGTKVALGHLDALQNIDWLADSQKEEHARLGRLGSYFGSAIYEIPQRFDPKETFNGETLKTLVPDDILLFVAGDDKWVKVVRSGETEINEVTEKGEANGYVDDVQKYEVREAYGVGTQIGRYHGLWKITT